MPLFRARLPIPPLALSKPRRGASKGCEPTRNIILKSASFVILLFLSVSLETRLYSAPPVALYSDTMLVHDVKGFNSFPSRKRKETFVLDILPFYQSASGAKDCNGTKVPLGDRIGRPHMIGLLHGTGAAPGGSLSGGSTPVLLAASQALNGPVVGTGGFNYNDPLLSDSSQLFGFYSVPVSYEKYGFRGKASVRLIKGLSIEARSGAAYYRQAPTFNDLTPSSTGDATGLRSESDRTVTQTMLMSQAKRDDIASEIGLNLDKYSTFALEDTHISLWLRSCFEFEDDQGKHALSFMPAASIGVWIPSGRDKDQDRGFGLPMGNDGFWGATVETALNFDFPNTIQIGIGGAVLIFEKKLEHNFRLPTSDTQKTIYPWKTTVSRRLGTTWNFHAGFKAEDFLDNFSFYFNYVFARHEEDSITVKDADSSRGALFLPKKHEDETSWTSQAFHFGLENRFARNLTLGLAAQAPITGKNIYRNTTVIGMARFVF